MGSITTGVGLISGINTGQLIDSLIALESRGKTNLQQRVADLTAQRTAIMDINARLLNMKTIAKSFRLDKIFQSALAISSDEDVLTATAGKNAQPGTFQFIVKQLVATSQQLTKGFADKTSTPLGVSSLSFEFGHGGVSTDKDLEQLNAGNGVARGHIKITDRSGATATVDLTDVTTLNETLDRINAVTAIKVKASVEGDHLVITDSTGAIASNLIVANGDGDTTATDLGIASSVAANTITGTNINTIGGGTALGSLNDGNGVLTRNNVADFTITARDGTALNVNLGRVNKPISNATLLSDLNNGLGITISSDENNKDIKLVSRDGTVFEVNLTGLTTVGGLLTKINGATGGKIVLSINPDGKHFTVSDTTGGLGNLKVLGDGANNIKTAKDLGILNIAGVAADSFEGNNIPNTISDPAASTITSVLDRINNATGNGGKIVASIAPDGVSLLITDSTGGAGNLIIRRSVSNPSAAGSLGIETAVGGVAASTVDGNRLVASLGSVLVRNINGGSGLGAATTLNITDRNGVSFSLTNADTFDSLGDLIKQVNASATAAGAGISVGLNNAGNGLQVTDNSGGVGNLIVAGDAASVLGISGNVAATSIHGTNVQQRYVSDATHLSDLNYGRGIGTGKFRITDGLGESAVIDIGSDSTTLYDVIQEINSRGLAINARVNDHGDGLLLEAKLGVGQTASSKIKVEGVSGSTAKDLNIIGTSATVDNASIDGSYERIVALSDGDTLAKVVAKINAAGIPVSASVINAGTGATPYRINFTSGISGKLGELVIDGGAVDLGLTSLTKGHDAKIFFGSDNIQEGQLLTSASNSVTGVLDGVTIDLKKTSDTAVTLTVKRDTDAITSAVKQLVTTFNDATARINQYDFYNVDTQQKGALLGDPTAGSLRDTLYRAVQGQAQNVTTQYKYLRQVGITIGADGQLKFDQDKFASVYQSDPEAVTNLFATFESSAGGSETIAPGVTVVQTKANVTARGFGDLFDHLLDGLTNTIDGVVTLADKNFKDQIDLANKRIAIFDERLADKRTRLQAQFANMETALAKLQGQGNSLNSLANSVALAQSFK